MHARRRALRAANAIVRGPPCASCGSNSSMAESPLCPLLAGARGRVRFAPAGKSATEEVQSLWFRDCRVHARGCRCRGSRSGLSLLHDQLSRRRAHRERVLETAAACEAWNGEPPRMRGESGSGSRTPGRGASASSRRARLRSAGSALRPEGSLFRRRPSAPRSRPGTSAAGAAEDGHGLSAASRSDGAPDAPSPRTPHDPASRFRPVKTYKNGASSRRPTRARCASWPSTSSHNHAP
jgi:hypothetical protein